MRPRTKRLPFLVHCRQANYPRPYKYVCVCVATIAVPCCAQPCSSSAVSLGASPLSASSTSPANDRQREGLVETRRAAHAHSFSDSHPQRSPSLVHPVPPGPVRAVQDPGTLLKSSTLPSGLRTVPKRPSLAENKQRASSTFPPVGPFPFGPLTPLDAGSPARKTTVIQENEGAWSINILATLMQMRPLAVCTSRAKRNSLMIPLLRNATKNKTLAFPSSL